MQLVIRSSDPDEIDVNEVKAAIEARGYIVSGITVERISTRPTAPKELPPVPEDFPVKVLVTEQEKASAKDLVTCGTCGRSWDDGVSTELTPTPSARCPFEYYH